MVRSPGSAPPYLLEHKEIFTKFTVWHILYWEYQSIKENNSVCSANTCVTDLFMASVPACNAFAQAAPSQFCLRWGAAADKKRQYNCEEKD